MVTYFQKNFFGNFNFCGITSNVKLKFEEGDDNSKVHYINLLMHIFAI